MLWELCPLVPVRQCPAPLLCEGHPQEQGDGLHRRRGGVLNRTPRCALFCADCENRKGPSSNNVSYLLRLENTGAVRMDHEQNFCPGGTCWHDGCTSNHYGLDFC